MNAHKVGIDRRKSQKTEAEKSATWPAYPNAYALQFGRDAICRIAQFQVRKSFIERSEEAMRSFVQHVKRNEPGTLLYISFQSKHDRSQFVHFMVFEDARALAKHGLSTESKRLMELLNPYLVSHVAASNFERVAST